ncbi:fructosamine kinase family protein [Halofilum ochraceum]|uniref:fructosamine kinase family protein n=1 Tax=Halofilum ochraceum TaxID=1611323 RepID=UPI0008DA162B|nr:fructosamine kinase family protein [Halofilum ochraceum]
MTQADKRFLDAIAQALEPAGIAGPLRQARPVAGGCIHETARVTAGDGRALFLKANSGDHGPMLAAEAYGLKQLAAADGPRVPRVLGHGVAHGRAWLMTEYLDLQPSGDAAGYGHELARMHAYQGEAFGLDHDNWIGTTEQPNGPHEDWVTFWRERRLGHQLELAAADGHAALVDRGRRLAGRLDELFGGHQPPPSLLHGDLWSGNQAYDRDGRGVVFDPAVYFGDREADLAMTELFGGLPDAFWSAYCEAWPLEPGYPVRRELYNLYHVLNHAHLFGGGYVPQSARMIDRLLAEVGNGS